MARHCPICSTPLAYGPHQHLAVCGDYVLPAWITGTWRRVPVCAPCFAVGQSLTVRFARSFAQVRGGAVSPRTTPPLPQTPPEGTGARRRAKRADWTIESITQALHVWSAAHGGHIPMITDYRQHDPGLPTLRSLYLTTCTEKLTAAYAVLEAHGAPVFTAYQAQLRTRYAANGRRVGQQSWRKTTHREEAPYV